MRRCDLTVRVLEKIAEGAVEDTRDPGGERCRMTARRDALPSGLHADQVHARA